MIINPSAFFLNSTEVLTIYIAFSVAVILDMLEKKTLQVEKNMKIW